MEKCPWQEDGTEIAFEVGEAKYPNNDDALVISIKMVMAQVKRLMVGT